MAIFFAVIAMVSWGVGDFLIQKGTRTFGDWKTLFYICAMAVVVLFPFSYPHLNLLLNPQILLILLLASLMILFAALTFFEALKQGKMIAVEPIFSFELPITALLAALIIHEKPSSTQIILILIIACSITLLSIRSFKSLKKITFEKGTWLGLLAVLGMGASNFLFGLGSRETNPIFVNWFVSVVVGTVVLIYLLRTSSWKEIFTFHKQEKKLAVSLALIDNLAWVAFAASAIYIPIAVAAGISESYVIIAVLLGMIFNKEKLKKYQWLGLTLALISVVALGVVTDK